MKKLLLMLGVFLSLHIQAMDSKKMYELSGGGIEGWIKDVGQADLVDIQTLHEKLQNAIRESSKTHSIPRLLRGEDAGLDINLDELLRDAIENRNALAVKHLLDSGADPLKKVNGKNALELVHDFKRGAVDGSAERAKYQMIQFQIGDATKKAKHAEENK